MRRFISCTILAALAATIPACATEPQTRATAVEKERGQSIEFRRLFNLKEGFQDMVVRTWDLSEEVNRWEKTLLVVFRNDTHNFLEMPTLDRKMMGTDRVRHRIAEFWTMDLRQDPLKPVVVLLEATAEFVTALADKNAKTAEPGITSLKVDIRFMQIDRNGKIAEVEQRPGEAAGAFAALLAMSQREGADPVPLHWQLLFRFALSDKISEGGGTENAVKAATGYQWILDTIAHAKAGSDADELKSAQNDVTNADYIAKLARKRLENLK